jgi:hypothetical protein
MFQIRDSSTRPRQTGSRYLPGAVALTPYTHLQYLSGAIGVTDSYEALIFGYVRTSIQPYAIGNSQNSAGIWGLQSGFQWFTSAAGVSGTHTQVAEGVPGIFSSYDNASFSGNKTTGTFRASFSDPTSVSGGGAGAHSFQPLKFSALDPYYGRWVAVLMAASLNYGSNLKRVAVYYAAPGISGGAWVNQNMIATGTGALTAPPNMNNAGGFALGYYAEVSTMASDQAQFYLKLGVKTVNGVSLVSAADGGGICYIDPTILNRFYNGGPIDFGPDGANPLSGLTLVGDYTNGAKPDLHFVGDKNSFLTNRGTATGLTALALGTTGVGAQYVPLASAGRGPGADASIPDYTWIADNGGSGVYNWTVNTKVLVNQWVTVGSTAGTSQVYQYTTAGTTLGTGTGPTGTGAGISDGTAVCSYVGTYKNVALVGGFSGAQVGDLMVLAVNCTDLFGTSTLANAARTISISGWTLQGTAVAYDDGSGYGGTVAVFTRIAVAGDNLATWVLSVVPTTGAIPSFTQWTAIGYRNVHVATPIAAVAQVTKTGANITAASPTKTAYSPSVLTNKPNSLVVTILFFDAIKYTASVVPPSGADLRYCPYSGSTALGQGTVIVDRMQPAIGASVSEGLLTGTAHPAVMFTLALNPM